jgi:hypothetical protein
VDIVTMEVSYWLYFKYFLSLYYVYGYKIKSRTHSKTILTDIFY